MEIYLLKSAACLVLFFIFYKVFLERTSIHQFKRFYLFGSLILSFLIPFITFTTFVEPLAIEPIYYSENFPPIAYETVKSINYWPFVLWIIYGLGFIFFCVKFSKNLFTLIQKIHQNPKYRHQNFINILLNETVVPHTFFSYIFLNKTQFEKNEIPNEVMLHEESHALQKHSLDILFIEILQIVFWFNPLLYFIKRSIKLNHEFLADQAVLNAGAEISEYQKILLTFSSNTQLSSLAHSINYSSVKKRFTVMKTHTSKRAVLLRSLLLLPLLSIMIYGFSTKETVERNTLSRSISTNDTIEDILIKIDENSKISLNGKSVALSNLKEEINKLISNLKVEQKYRSASIQFGAEANVNIAEEIRGILQSCGIENLTVTISKNEKDAGLKHVSQNNSKVGKTTLQKATKAEVKEYNKLAKKYNVIAIEKRVFKAEDLKRLEAIYNKMDDEQKAKAAPFPKSNQPQFKNTTSKKSSFIFNTNLKINDSIPAPATPSFYTKNKDVKLDNAAIFIYNDLVISEEKANELLKDNNKLRIYITKNENGGGTVLLSETPVSLQKKTAPASQSLTNKGTVLNLSNLKKTGFHFNTNETTNLPMYYYKDKLIPFSKVHKLLSENKAMKMYIMTTGDEKNTIILSEKPVLGNTRLQTTTTITETPQKSSTEKRSLYNVAQSPPPPNSDSVEYIKELAKRGAIFYIGPHKYSADEAIKMVKKSTNKITIDVSKYPDVLLGGC